LRHVGAIHDGEQTMSTFLIATLALGLSTPAQADKSDKDAVKGATVTISGCVITDKENSFMLAQVEEVAGPTSTTPNATLEAMSGLTGGAPGAVYWLSSESVKLMRGHLGHKVQVTGTITDVTSGTVKVKQEPGKDGPNNTVKVEARDKEVKAKTDEPLVAGFPAYANKEETKTMPVRRVKVETVKMLATTCR